MKNPLLIVTREDIVDLQPLVELMHTALEERSLRDIEILLMELTIHLKEHAAREMLLSEQHILFCEELRSALKRGRIRLKG